MISMLITVLIIIIVAAVILWACRYLGLPEPLDKIAVVAVVIFVLIALVMVLKGNHISL